MDDKRAGDRPVNRRSVAAGRQASLAGRRGLGPGVVTDHGWPASGPKVCYIISYHTKAMFTAFPELLKGEIGMRSVLYASVLAMAATPALADDPPDAGVTMNLD